MAAKLGRDLTTRIVAQSICVRRLRFCRPVDTRHLGLYILSMRLFHNNRNTLLHTLYTLSLYLSDTHTLTYIMFTSFFCKRRREDILYIYDTYPLRISSGSWLLWLPTHAYS